jgi:hypothetical protein
VISEASEKEKVHLDVTLKEWSEFVVGQRSFGDQNISIEKFESVLSRTTSPADSEALDDKLDDVAEDVGYTCDGGGDN